MKGYWVEGKITLVDLTDFECPRCRQVEPDLETFRKKKGDQLHFVRLATPMPTHPNARPAARAYQAAVAQGKGEEMAAALFRAPSRAADECRRLRERSA